jgi:hypothetical protein
MLKRTELQVCLLDDGGGLCPDCAGTTLAPCSVVFVKVLNYTATCRHVPLIYANCLRDSEQKPSPLQTLN